MDNNLTQQGALDIVLPSIEGLNVPTGLVTDSTNEKLTSGDLSSANIKKATSIHFPAYVLDISKCELYACVLKTINSLLDSHEINVVGDGKYVNIYLINNKNALLAVGKMDGFLAFRVLKQYINTVLPDAVLYYGNNASNYKKLKTNMVDYIKLDL